MGVFVCVVDIRRDGPGTLVIFYILQSPAAGLEALLKAIIKEIKDRQRVVNIFVHIPGIEFLVLIKV